MHILYVADEDSKYGASNSLLQLVSEIRKLDDSIKVSVVLTKNSNRVEDYQKIGCDAYRISYVPFCHGIPYEHWKIPLKWIIYGILYLYGRCASMKELERQLDIRKVDMIHSNSTREDFGATVAEKYGIPLVWHIREFDNLHYRCFSYRKNYVELMNHTAAKMIAISNAVKEHWIQKGVWESKIIHIANGVKENERQKQKYPEENGMVQFVMLGALNWAKGQHQIIKAIALLPEGERERVRLDIVGDGSSEYMNILKRLIKGNCLDGQIRLLGYQKNFYQRLCEYDCGIMCSKCEGFGRVTAEYMMAGLPVIASDTGANPELIEEQFNGLLYRYDNVEDLADKIRYLLGHAGCIERLGRNAYACAVKKYTASMNASKVYEEYKKLLEGRKN